MDYVIGIDGGGTRSSLLAADLSGRTLTELEGGPTNLHALGADAVERELRRLLRQAVLQAGLQPDRCRAICLGNAGVDKAEERADFERLLASCGLRGRITVTNDAETVLVAGSGRRVGAVIIAGTGSLAYGINEAGERARAGGWGHLAGDEGSGFDIGIRAVRAALRSYDGREAPTLLLPYLLKELGLERAEDIKTFVYKHEGKHHIAALSRVVHAAFLDGDRRAKGILQEAVDDLFELTNNVMRKLHFDNGAVDVVCGGSIFKYVGYVHSEFAKRLKTVYPGAQAIVPQHNAAYGAAKIALLSL